MSDEVWTNEGNECLLLRINGREEKINKGTIDSSNLRGFIGGKAVAAGVSKYRVSIDGEKVNSPEEANEFDLEDIKVIEINTYDKVAC